MSNMHVLIIGCGSVGTALGLQLLDAGYRVSGVRRTINQLPQGIHGIAADLHQLDSLQNLPAADYVVFSAAASSHSEADYRATYVDGLKATLAALPTPPKHIFFTSSTGVYHQADHSWVDETSPCQPTRFSGAVMLEAEQALLHSGIPATVVRFSGIYGASRTRMLETVRSGKGAPAEPLSYSNRIHQLDCARVLAHLIEYQRRGNRLAPVYLASDDQPVPLHEVTDWLAQQLDVTLTDPSLGRFAGSKRCDNSLLKSTGFTFQYPGYQQGYQEML